MMEMMDMMEEDGMDMMEEEMQEMMIDRSKTFAVRIHEDGKVGLGDVCD